MNILNRNKQFKQEGDLIWVRTAEHDLYSYKIGRIYHNDYTFSYGGLNCDWFCFLSRKKLLYFKQDRIVLTSPSVFFGKSILADVLACIMMKNDIVK